MAERKYILRPEDRDWRVAKLAADGLRQAAKQGRQDAQPVEVIIRPWQPPRTDPQRRTMWQWHGQVASELTIRTSRRWSKEDVHELVFLERWMPRIEFIVPDTGEIKSRPLRTSDKVPDELKDEHGQTPSMKQIISNAMTQYLAWIYEMGIEVTVPGEGW